MSTKVSTGLRNKVLDTGSLKARLSGSFVDIYSGTEPATADAALGAAVKLVRVSLASTATGVTFGAAAAGVLPKNGSETWSGLGIAAGTATFYRIVVTGDDGTLSTTQERVQGAAAELPLSGAIEVGSTVTLNSFDVTFPTL